MKSKVYDDLRCIAVVIIWILAGLFLGMILGDVCIALWVLAQIYFHDQSLDPWVLVCSGVVASVITLLVINKWLAGGKKMNQKEIEIVIKHIITAKKHIDEDPHLANYVLRDLEVMKETGLTDLSWSMHKNGCVKEDVEYLISQLEEYLDKHKEV